MVINLVVNESELQKIGSKFADCIIKQPQPLLVFLQGDLGTGKTLFARAFIQSFGFSSVKSPTYSIVKSYPINLNGSKSYIHHFDCYRLNSEMELKELGLEEYLEHNICLFEWPEQFTNILPQADFQLQFFHRSNPNQRQLSFNIANTDLFICLKPYLF